MTGKVYGEAFAVIPESVLYSLISANAKVLYGILQRHADPSGRCYPGRKRLAELMRVSEDTIDRAKKELISFDFLESAPCYDDAGRQTTDTLILRLPLRKSAEGEGRKFAAPGSKAITNEKKLSAGAAKTTPPHLAAAPLRFECPVCQPGQLQDDCSVCAGTGTFTSERGDC